MITPDKIIQLASSKPGKTALTGAALGAVVLAIFFYIPDGRTRWIALGLLAAIVGLVVLIRFVFHWRTRGQGKAMQQAIEAEQQGALSIAPAEERARVEEIRRRFQEAVDELRKAGRSVYDLPWYLLIGEPQSGKSMTLRGSELHFPVGTDKLSGLGGTRNCDWWFTNEAVILDTAGRFTFQEAGAPDKAEWEGFLRLLSKRRRHCPINGVIVVIPADALLNDSSEVRREKAKNIQLKLGELQRELGVQFPVFVLITKCDLVLGFSEFFRSFGDVQAAQLIGWSNEAPFNKPYDEAGFESSFQSVYQKLSRQRLEVLRKPASLDERGLGFSFPEEFKALSQPLQQYFRIMFSQDIYHDPLFFRGYYFTSGVQMGEPIAKMWREVLGGGAAPGQKEFDPLGSLFPPRPFFIADFYKRKALRERGLVFRSEAEIRRGRTLRKWTYAFVGVAGAVLATFLILGGIKVNSLLTEPMKHAQRADTLIKDTGLPIGREDLSTLYSNLSKDAENLRAGGFWFRIMTAFHSGHDPAKHLLTLHDALFMRRELLPLTGKLEQRLAEPWPTDLGPQYSDSLKEYVAWWTGNPPGSASAEAAMRRMYAPIWEEVPLDVQEKFKALEHFDLLGKQAMSVDAVAGGRLHRAIQAAHQYYLGYANGELECDECELSHWVRLHRACKAFEARRGDVLGLTPRFADVQTIGQYDAAATDWRKLYQAPWSPGEFMSFSAAVGQIKAKLPKLRVKSLPPDAKVEAEFELPDFEQVRQAWRTYFHHLDETVGTLYRMVEGSDLLLGTRERVQGWLAEVSSELDGVGQDTLKNARDAHADYGRWLYRVADFRPAPADVVGKLAAIDAWLPQTRPLRIGDDLGEWPGILESLKTATANRPPESAVAAAADPRWQWTELLALESAVEKAAKRHTWYVELGQACRLLSERDIEVLRADPEWPAKPYPALQPAYGPVPQRWTAASMQEVVQAVERLQRIMQECRNQRLTLVGDADAAGVAGDLDPANRLSNELDTELAEYARRYFDAWCDQYRKARLASYDRLIHTQDWKEYYSLLHDPADPREDFGDHARSQWAAMIEHVLTVEDAGVPSGRSGDAAWTDGHQRMIDGARAATAVCGPRFSESRRAARRSRTEDLQSRASEAFEAFRSSVRNIGPSLDASKSGGLPDLSTGPLDALMADVPNENISKQVLNVALHGRYLLNRELDDRLEKIAQNFRENAFPFIQPAAEGDKPAEAGADKFQGFLLDVYRFSERFGAIAEIEQQSFRPEDSRVGRNEFLRRADGWRQFLYGTAKDEKARGTWDTRDLARSPVFFDVTYVEPTGQNRIATVYSHAELGLGGRAGARQDLIYDDSRLIRVNMTTPLGNPPESRGWRFGQPSSVSLRLTREGQSYVVPTATLNDTIWALPLFIYRFCKPSDFGRVAPGTDRPVSPRTVWPVQIPIPLNNVTYYIQFTIELKSCGEGSCVLPEPIGWFEPSTKAPNLLPLD